MKQSIYLEHSVGSITMATYSARLIMTWLKEHNIQFKPASSSIGILHYVHGVRVLLPHSTCLSVQTHPDIAATAFAETFLIRTCDDDDSFTPVNDEELGYDEDVQRFGTPEELFNHIEKVVAKLNVDPPTNQPT